MPITPVDKNTADFLAAGFTRPQSEVLARQIEEAAQARLRRIREASRTPEPPAQAAGGSIPRISQPLWPEMVMIVSAVLAIWSWGLLLIRWLR
jgi:hypothetical protein